MKKKFALLSLILIVFLGACRRSAKSDERSDISGHDGVSSEPLVFSMFVADPGQLNDKNNRVMQTLSERTGVTLEVEFCAGDLSQRVGVMIASGDYPDFINPGQSRSRLTQAGAFAALDAFIPQYPNIASHFAPYMERLRNASHDGNIYLLDNWDRYYFVGDDSDEYLPEHNGPAFWVQKDVLADAGYIIPKTPDEFFDMLEAYYAKHPVIDGLPTLPFEILSYDWRMFCLFNPAQHMIGGPNDGDVFVNKETLKSEIYINKDYAKAYYQKLNEIYKKGLISPGTFTQNYNQYLSNIAAGRVLAMFDQQWNFADGELVLISENKIERTYVPIGITHPGYEEHYRVTPYFVGGSGTGISIRCKDVPRAMAFIDQLLDEEIQKMLYWGFEGEHYYLDNGRFRRTAEQKNNYDNNDWRIANLGNILGDNFPKIEGQFSDGNAVDPNDQPEEKRDNMFPYDIEFFGRYGFNSKSDFLAPPTDAPAYFPAWAFTLEDGGDAKVAIDNIKELARMYLPRAIMADDFEAAWGEFIRLVEQENYAAYEAEIDRQIAARTALLPK